MNKNKISIFIQTFLKVAVFSKLMDAVFEKACKYIHVKFYFSRVCRTHTNFQLFIKLLLKMRFFCKFFFFGSLKTRHFLPSMKFSLNYHQQNIHAFLKEMTVKYLFQ